MSKRTLGEGRGVLLTVEGCDGAGKTTQAKYLAEYLTVQHGYDVILTREPGGTDFAMEARKLMFNDLTAKTSPDVQALLIAAARRDHVEKVIEPAIAAGKIVVCDRFTLSTRMYQRDAVDLDAIITIGSKGIVPAETLIFDVEYDVSRQRLKARSIETNEKTNWLDNAERIEHAYRQGVLLNHAKCNPFNTVVFDANQSLDDVTRALRYWIDGQLVPALTAIRKQTLNDKPTYELKRGDIIYIRLNETAVVVRMFDRQTKVPPNNRMMLDVVMNYSHKPPRIGVWSRNDYQEQKYISFNEHQISRKWLEDNLEYIHPLDGDTHEQIIKHISEILHKQHFEHEWLGEIK